MVFSLHMSTFRITHTTTIKARRHRAGMSDSDLLCYESQEPTTVVVSNHNSVTTNSDEHVMMRVFPGDEQDHSRVIESASTTDLLAGLFVHPPPPPREQRPSAPVGFRDRLLNDEQPETAVFPRRGSRVEQSPTVHAPMPIVGDRLVHTPPPFVRKGAALNLFAVRSSDLSAFNLTTNKPPYTPRGSEFDSDDDDVNSLGDIMLLPPLTADTVSPLDMTPRPLSPPSPLLVPLSLSQPARSEIFRTPVKRDSEQQQQQRYAHTDPLPMSKTKQQPRQPTREGVAPVEKKQKVAASVPVPLPSSEAQRKASLAAARKVLDDAIDIKVKAALERKLSSFNVRIAEQTRDYNHLKREFDNLMEVGGDLDRRITSAARGLAQRVKRLENALVDREQMPPPPPPPTNNKRKRDTDTVAEEGSHICIECEQDEDAMKKRIQSLEDRIKVLERKKGGFSVTVL